MEDEMHLFVDCCFARRIWQSFNLDNIIPVNNACLNIKHWFKFWMNDKLLYEKRNMISLITWSIWKYRNKVNFDNVIPDVHNLIELVRASLQNISPVKNSLTNYVTSIAKKVQLGNNLYSQANYEWIIQFDASFVEADYSMGYAISILNKTGRRLHCRAGRGWATSPLDAEAKACLEALSWMKELKLQNVCLVNDCQVLMKILNGEAESAKQPWRSQSSINRCKFSLINVISVSFMYKARKHIHVEDKIAKEVRSRNISFFSTENMNHDVMDKILDRVNHGLTPILYTLNTSADK